ncbi:MAG: NADH-quinone oxidoreductase subunit C/D, partial [Arsenophonus sp. ET-DL12-MAG3]
MIKNQIIQQSIVRPVWKTYDHYDDPIILTLHKQFSSNTFSIQATRTGILVVWIKHKQFITKVIEFLKKQPKPYIMLFDLHAIDER